MTYIEIFKICSKNWLDIKDIQDIAGCGRDKANEIANAIIRDINNSGKKVPQSKKKIVPTDYVIDYLNIDMDFVLKMAKNEKVLLS